MIRLSEEKKKILDSFLAEVDLANHYRDYRWGRIVGVMDSMIFSS